MNFSIFLNEFNKLPDKYGNIILLLLGYLEHNCEKRNELMALTLAKFMQENNISKSKIIYEIKEKEKENIKNENQRTSDNIRETAISAINRFSEGSTYYNDISKIIGFNTEFIANESFYSRPSYLHNLWDKEYKKDYANEVGWLWDTLSEQNQKIVYFLVCALNNIDDFKDLHKYYEYDHNHDKNYDYLNSDDRFSG